ncbi:MAG: hypothetical protein ACE5OZ_03060 [Candidatus Heimdallarchaeota archaeon]
MLELIVPVVLLAGFGYGVHSIAFRLSGSQIRLTEALTASVTLGTFCLVVPMLLVGTFFDSGLGKVVLSFAILGGILTLVTALRGTERMIETLRDTSTLKQVKGDELAYMVLIAFLFLDYVLYQLALPLRGWDALNVYFPDAVLFYLTDNIPLLNPFTFNPVYKEPLTSLLYTYVLILSKRPVFTMIPVLFFLTFLIVTYDLSIEIFDSKSQALFAVCVVWILPLTQTVFFEYAYYQDPFVATFFAITIYYTIKATKEEKGTTYYTLIATTAFALTLLTKLDGWAILLILPLLIPAGKQGKVAKIGLLSLAALFFAIEASTTQFVGSAIVVLLSTAICTYIIAKEPQSTARHKPLAFVMGIGFLVGSYWLLRLSREVPQVWDFLVSLYGSPGTTLLWRYPSSGFPLLAEVIDLIANPYGLFLFFGVGSAIFWTLFKVIGFWESYQRYSMLFVWIIVFSLVIFPTYYLSETYPIVLRYLSPILIPLALLITLGVEKAYKHFFETEIAELPFKLSFLFLGFIFLPAGDGNTPVFIKHISILRNLYIFQFSPLAQTYHVNFVWLTLWLLLIVFMLPLSLILSFKLIFDRESSASIPYIRTMFSIGLVVLIIAVPVFGRFDKEVALISRANNYEVEIEVDHKGVQQLMRFIEATDLESGFLVYDVPGIAFKTQHRVIDLGPWPFYPFTHFFDDEKNMTRNLAILDSAGINYIVVNKPHSRQYERFAKVCYPSVYFFRAVDNSLFFTKAYEDEYYTVYGINSYESFSGILDIYLGPEMGSNPLQSIFGAISGNTSFSDPLALNVLLDLSTFSFDSFSYNLSIALNSIAANTTRIIYYLNTANQAVPHPIISVFPFLKESYSLKSLNLTIKLRTFDGEETAALQYHLRGNISLLTTDHDVWRLQKGNGLQLV